jgi:hypothetical protein
MRLQTICEALSKGLLERTAALLNLPPKAIRDAIVKADIDETRLPHGDWICKQIASTFSGSGSGKFGEPHSRTMLDDLSEELHTLLVQFNAKKPNLDRLGMSKNINDYDMDSLEQALVSAATSANKEGEGVKKLGSAGPFTVYEVTDAQKLMELGEGTSWCTRGTYPGENRAEYYLEEHGSIYVIFKGDKPFMQICQGLSSPMDAKNNNAAIPTEVLKVLLRSGRPDSWLFYDYLAKHADDPEILMLLIDHGLSKAYSISLRSERRADKLAAAAQRLAQAWPSLDDAAQEKTKAFIASQPALAQEFSNSVRG